MHISDIHMCVSIHFKQDNKDKKKHTEEVVKVNCNSNIHHVTMEMMHGSFVKFVLLVNSSKHGIVMLIDVNSTIQAEIC